MISKFKIMWNHREDLRSIFSSIYFCFHYLPFRQAIHLPILLYKPHLLKMDGKICFAKGTKVHYGMVRLGFPKVSIYPSTGFIYENKGGTIIFKGYCFIGSNSAMSIAKGAKIIFGDMFKASATLKIVNYYSIEFEKSVRFGWDCMVMDTDFHKLTKLAGGYTKGYGPIKIGAGCWIANSCKIMKRTNLPNYCVVSAGTILSEKVDAPEYSIIGSRKTVGPLYTGVYRNPLDDKIDYN